MASLSAIKNSFGLRSLQLFFTATTLFTRAVLWRQVEESVCPVSMWSGLNIAIEFLNSLVRKLTTLFPADHNQLGQHQPIPVRIFLVLDA
jgi:hypothetical protein